MTAVMEAPTKRAAEVAKDVPTVLEDLSEDEAYLYAILTDESGLDIAEFLWYDPSTPTGCWRAWAFQWKWYRNTDALQIDQCARSVGKSLSIKVRGFAFPFIHPGEEMVITAPELVHLEPIVGLIEQQILATRLSRQMIPNNRSSITHRPFQMDFVNGARLIGRIPQRDGKGVKGCVGAGTPILTDHGYVPVEDLQVGDMVLTHRGRWRPVQYMETDVNDCYEVRGQGSFPMVVSCDHRFWGMENTGTQKTARRFEPPRFHDVEFLIEHQVYWGTPTEFPELDVPPLVGAADDGSSRHPEDFSDNIYFWWLTGRWLADGYLTRDKANNKGRRVKWVVHPDKLDSITSALEMLGLTYRVIERDHSSAVIVEIANAAWNRWLFEHFGEHADGKRLPAWLLGALPKIRGAVLDGYLQGDGHWNAGRHRWELGTASKVLAVGLQHLAQGAGYTVNCTSVQPKVTEIMGVPLKAAPKVSWRLQLTTRGHPPEVDGHRFGKVKTVTPVGKQTVYNPVITEDHSYVSGSIVSHNVHPIWLELDEAQDYPHPGWVELTETLKRGHEGAVWRAHGVTRGMRDDFYEHTQPGPDNLWTIHQFMAMHRPTWTDQERDEKIKQYGTREDPDYRRNVMGFHGDSTNPMFVLHRLMACVDDDPTSDYNGDEYFMASIKSEHLGTGDLTIEQILDFPRRHLVYKTRPTNNQNPSAIFWVGMDVGYTVDPSEITVWVEYRHNQKDPVSKLRLLTRVQLVRMGHHHQVEVMRHVIDFYEPRVFAMDSGGLGLPLYQDVQEQAEIDPAMVKVRNSIKGYNFASKAIVELDAELAEAQSEFDDPKDAGIVRNMKEYGSDVLRDLVDAGRLELPWDGDLLRQYQGGTWAPARGLQDQYGRRIYNQGNDHILDSSRFFALGWAQFGIEEMLKPKESKPVLDSFL